MKRYDLGEWVRYDDVKELCDVVNKFFEYLEYTEVSDSGREFHPINISCCRVLLHEDVSKCLVRMKQLANKE
jgi:hypothetical protein